MGRENPARTEWPARRLTVILLAAALALLTLLAYWRAPGSDFIGDDYAPSPP